MSGYRAAPVKAKLRLEGELHYTNYSRRIAQWHDDCENEYVCDESTNNALDAIYWSRIDALDSAAAACEAIGDARGAEAVRRLKEQQ